MEVRQKMTKEEAKVNQERMAENYSLGFWYGVRCEKCCEVYPKLNLVGDPRHSQCYYECEVCGKRTKLFTMPWESERAWNNHEYEVQQMRWF